METNIITSKEIQRNLQLENNKFLEELLNTQKLLSSEEETYTKRLKKFGVRTESTKKLEGSKKTKLLKLKNKGKSLLESFEYYKIKYPKYNVVSLSAMMKTCEKYGLYIGLMDFYKKDIPYNNLSDLEEFEKLFKGVKDDLYYDHKVKSGDSFSKLEKKFKMLNKKRKREQKKFNILNDVISSEDFELNLMKRRPKTSSRKMNLHIVAPIDHFDMTKNRITVENAIYDIEDIDIKNYLSKESIKEARRLQDPIIWTPVRLSKDKVGCMIITKWGEEAKYPEFVNPIEN